MEVLVRTGGFSKCVARRRMYETTQWVSLHFHIVYLSLMIVSRHILQVKDQSSPVGALAED